jgi:hypothetical protein
MQGHIYTLATALTTASTARSTAGIATTMSARYMCTVYQVLRVHMYK